jgi:hypothetical protein
VAGRDRRQAVGEAAVGRGVDGEGRGADRAHHDCACARAGARDVDAGAGAQCVEEAEG